ncbi:MAG: YtxH domain-containing protein [candidate division SR1 bacterium]|nr:YtxH domain-containing protein [candidate division SR1 bacterium]
MFSFYNKYKQENQKKVLTSAVLGIIAGAVTALFISPMRGSQARKMVTDKAKKVAQDMEDKFSYTAGAVGTGIKDISNNIRDKAEEVKSTAVRDINKGRSKTADGLSDASDKINPHT